MDTNGFNDFDSMLWEEEPRQHASIPDFETLHARFATDQETHPLVVSLQVDSPLKPSISDAEQTYSCEEFAMALELNAGMDEPVREAVAAFLDQMGSVLEARGSVLTPEAVRHLSADLQSGKGEALMHEPWMSFRKIARQDAENLGAVALTQALRMYGFERINDASPSNSFPKTEKELRQQVYEGNQRTLVGLRDALKRIGQRSAVTISLTLDYVLGCCGERNSMMRLNYALKKIARELSPSRSKYRANLYLLADAWRRYSSARYLYGNNQYDLFTDDFAEATFNMLDGTSAWTSDEIDMLPASSLTETAKELSRSIDKNRVDLAASVTVTVLDGIGPEPSVEQEYEHLLRPFPVVAAPDPDTVYNTLTREFPWMDELNEAVAYAAALSSRRGDKGFVMAPTLLLGGPGVGKSRWARRVPEIVGVPVHSVSLAGISSSKSVIGSERGWSSARPSLPAFAFTGTKVANPFITVDEVDKSMEGSGDAIEGLLPMMEKETSRRYHDIYLLGNFDLSRIIWVFTANSISGLNQSFLDRVRVFNVPRPDVRHYPAIASALVEEVRAEYGLQDGFDDDFDRLRERALDEIGRGNSIRSAGNNLRAEVGKLVWKKPSRLTVVKS